MKNTTENALAALSKCDPEQCPIVDSCPVGPTPHLPCEIKALFHNSLHNHIANAFLELHHHPDVSLRLNFLLKPLFEQLLRLRMAETAFPNIVATNKYGVTGINPILKEIRQTVLAIDKILVEALRSYNDLKKGKKSDNPLGMTGKGYYEMLLIDGQSSVQDRVGVPD